jgi:ferritin-like metal-binding protein YciE
MTKASQQKVVQYLHEARASEDALVRVLQSQIAMTPRGSYRGMLEAHLGQARDHTARVGERLKALDEGSSPLMAVVGFWGDVVGQALAFSKTPFALLRGPGGEEKVLKNAKDACATEALEIATYTAIERLARSVGDQETAMLAASILADEWKMLQRVLREIPRLTEAVVCAEGRGPAVLRPRHHRCCRRRPRSRRGCQGRCGQGDRCRQVVTRSETAAWRGCAGDRGVVRP